MTTAFKQMLVICGLNKSETADYLNVSEAAVQSWMQERRTVPQGVIIELFELHNKMQIAADEAVKLIKQQAKKQGCLPDEIDFSFSNTRGQWPSLRCALTVEAMIRLERNYHVNDEQQQEL